MGTASISVLTAFFLARTNTARLSYGSPADPHRILGYVVVFGGAVVQPVIGICRPHNPSDSSHEKTISRKTFEVVHKNLGRIVAIAAIFNVYLGINLLEGEELGPYQKLWIAGFALLFAIFVVLQFKQLRKDKATKVQESDV